MKLSPVVLLVGLLPVALHAQSRPLDAAIKQYETCHCTEAAAKIELAAEQGSVLAMRNTGIINEEGTAVRRNYLQAVNWYRRAAAAGDHIAAVRLASLLHRLGQDEEAKNLLQREITGPAGAQALFELGQIAATPTTGAPPDFAKARSLYQQASRGGDMAATRELGWMMAKGVGGPANPEQGNKLLRAAATDGDANAMLMMGDIARDNPDRVTASILAPGYYETVGKNGNPEGYFRAAAMFEFSRIRGLGGVGYSPNYQRILGWLERAAASADPLAAMNARARIVDIARDRATEAKKSINMIQDLDEVRTDPSGVTTLNDPDNASAGLLLCLDKKRTAGRVASLTRRCAASLGNPSKGPLIDISCEWVAAGYSYFAPGQCKWARGGAFNEIYLSVQFQQDGKWSAEPIVDNQDKLQPYERDCGDPENNFLFFTDKKMGTECLGRQIFYNLHSVVPPHTKLTLSF
jgi:hypothetical protein